jgi:hypothetical protein
MFNADFKPTHVLFPMVMSTIEMAFHLQYHEDERIYYG